MKNYIFTIISFFCFLFLFNSVFSQVENNEIKRYNIESAFIKYNISGNTKGKEILEFDNFGEREINTIDAIREVIFYSVKNIQKIKTLTILNNSFLFAMDLKNKTGVKTISKKYTNNNQFTKKDILKNGGKFISNEIVLDKKCEVWKTKNLKIWIWNDIALKIESKIIGKNYIKEAIEIKENITIEPNKLAIPIEIKITDYTK